MLSPPLNQAQNQGAQQLLSRGTQLQNQEQQPPLSLQSGEEDVDACLVQQHLPEIISQAMELANSGNTYIDFTVVVRKNKTNFVQ